MLPLTARLTVVLLMSTAVSALYQTPGSQEVLSTAGTLAAATNGSVEQFVASLAEAKIPVGVVLLEKDVRSKRRPLDTVEKGDRKTIDATFSIFEARYPDYQVERSPQGIVIVPREGGWCTQPLRSHLRSLAVTGEAFEVLYRIFRTWTDERGLYVPPGMVGRDSERSHAYRTAVTINVTNSSLENALNELVVQIPGLGWAVRETSWKISDSNKSGDSAARGCNLALFEGVGWLDTSWTLGVSAGR